MELRTPSLFFPLFFVHVFELPTPFFVFVVSIRLRSLDLIKFSLIITIIISLFSFGAKVLHVPSRLFFSIFSSLCIPSMILEIDWDGIK